MRSFINLILFFFVITLALAACDVDYADCDDSAEQVDDTQMESESPPKENESDLPKQEPEEEPVSHETPRYSDVEAAMSDLISFAHITCVGTCRITVKRQDGSYALYWYDNLDGERDTDGFTILKEFVT